MMDKDSINIFPDWFWYVLLDKHLNVAFLNRYYFLDRK